MHTQRCRARAVGQRQGVEIVCGRGVGGAVLLVGLQRQRGVVGQAEDGFCARLEQPRRALGLSHLARGAAHAVGRCVGWRGPARGRGRGGRRVQTWRVRVQPQQQRLGRAWRVG